MFKSLNDNAYPLVEELIKNKNKYKLKVHNYSKDVTIIDAGIEVKGNFEAGKIISEISMANLGKVNFLEKKIDNKKLGFIRVNLKEVVKSTLASQLAGWYIKLDNFEAIASGPARAIIKKPKFIFKKINHQEESKNAILILETDTIPNKEAIKYIKSKLKNNIILICAPINSIVGNIQVSARMVESCIHKMFYLNYDLSKILEAEGYAPIAPLSSDKEIMMGRSNDSIFYGGEVKLNLKNLEDIDPKKIPSNSSKDYNKLFFEIYKSVDNFYDIDPMLFAPAKIKIKIKNKEIIEGEINKDILFKSFKLD